MEDSKFKNNVTCKRGRKTLGYLLDFSLTLVFMIAIYVLTSVVFTNTSYYKGVNSEVTTIKNELYEYVEDTELGVLGDDGKLKGSSEMSELYVKGSVLHTLKAAGYSEVEISYSTYQGIEEVTSENDALYNYYVEYKPNNLENYDKTSSDWIEGSYGRDYYVNKVLKTSENKLFNSEKYPGIDLDVAVKIDNYFRDDSYSLGYTDYTLLYDLYYDSYNDAIDEVTTLDINYVKLNSTFEIGRLKLFDIYSIEIIISYILGFLVSYLLPILIYKNGLSFGFKVMKIGVCRNDNKPLNYKNNIVRGLILFIEEFFVVALFCMIIFSTDGVYLLMHEFLPNFSFFFILIFSLTLLVLSICLMLFSKEKKNTLSELVSKISVKDTREFIVEESETIDGTTKLERK